MKLAVVIALACLAVATANPVGYGWGSAWGGLGHAGVLVGPSAVSAQASVVNHGARIVSPLIVRPVIAAPVIKTIIPSPILSAPLLNTWGGLGWNGLGLNGLGWNGLGYGGLAWGKGIH